MNDTASLSRPASPARTADIVREYGPFEGAPSIHGVTHDGQHVWAATSERLLAIEPASGEIIRSIEDFPAPLRPIRAVMLGSKLNVWTCGDTSLSVLASYASPVL